MRELYTIDIVVGWEIEYTDEFESWWNGVSEDEQDAITAAVEVPRTARTGSSGGRSPTRSTSHDTRT